jgi:hypothetical protein
MSDDCATTPSTVYLAPMRELWRSGRRTGRAVLPSGCSASLFALLGSCAAPTGEVAWPIVLSTDFAGPALPVMALSDPAAFEVADAGGGSAFVLLRPADWQPPFRAPASIALFDGLAVGDFAFELRARQTGREYAHRDLCVFFAFDTPERFCYAHLASRADANAHDVFVVDGAPRRPIGTVRTSGVAWGDGWHVISVRRRGDVVEVHFDGELALRADRVPLGVGRLGVGSFDDTGAFDDVRITAPAVRRVEPVAFVHA